MVLTFLNGVFQYEEWWLYLGWTISIRQGQNTVNDIAIALQPVVHLDRFLVGEQSSIFSH